MRGLAGKKAWRGKYKKQVMKINPFFLPRRSHPELWRCQVADVKGL